MYGRKLDVGLELAMLCILRYTKALSEVPRDYKWKLDVELDVGFSCFIRHMMVQGDLPRD